MILFAVALALQCPDGSPPPCGRVRPAPAYSVAVLYFANASRDTTDEYLAEGITEEIATALGRVARLRVIAPPVVRRAQAASAGDLPRLVRTLNVRTLVEGSVRRAGHDLRITARLIDSDGRTAIWTEAWTRPAANLLVLEVEIAERIAQGVTGTLLPIERSGLVTRAAVDPVAYDHLLRGNFLLARRTAPMIRRAIDEYQAAIRRDTMYARGWARLALAHGLLRVWGFRRGADDDFEQVLARGEQAADRGAPA